MASATPWYLTREGLALLASLKARPRMKGGQNLLGPRGDIRYSYVGRKVEALELFWFRNSNYTANYTARGCSPYDVLGAIFGDPTGRAAGYITPHDRESSWQLIRDNVFNQARRHGFARLSLRAAAATKRVWGI